MGIGSVSSPLTGIILNAHPNLFTVHFLYFNIIAVDNYHVSIIFAILNKLKSCRHGLLETYWGCSVFGVGMLSGL